MRKAIQNTLSLFVLLTVSAFGLVNHVSAMPISMHEMDQGTSHSQHSQSNGSGRCATLCTSAIVSRDEEQDATTENEDDETVMPFYAQNQVDNFSDTLVSQKLYADSVKPPPKIPIYILYGVFRA